MIHTLRFVVTDEHLKLLRRMNVGWQGAPGIDCKRPYGNSAVEQDMHEILTGEKIGRPGSSRDSLTDAELDRYWRLHVETQMALQIALVVGKFEAGTYDETDEYRGDWKLIK